MIDISKKRWKECWRRERKERKGWLILVKRDKKSAEEEKEKKEKKEKIERREKRRERKDKEESIVE